MQESCVILLSSGLDSTVNLYEALATHKVVQALTFSYGQRAAKKEIEMATKVCKKHRVPHKVIDLKWMQGLGNSALNNKEISIPVSEQLQIDNLERCQQSAKAVWVPNRNGVFLNIGALFSEALGAKWVVPGFNAEEAATFSDNSAAYVKALDRSFYYSTASDVKVKCFTLHMSKTEIFHRGVELGVDFEYVWPCYFGEENPCGQCESCLRFEAAKKCNSKNAP